MSAVWLQRAYRLAGLIGAASVVGLLTISCGSSGGTEPVPTPGEQDAAAPADDAGQAADGSSTFEAGPFLEAGPCVPKPIDCTGKCGPVRDACSGEVKMCGGCPTGEVCDLQAHTCGKPKVTCTDFGAECGQVKTSCGEYKFCGDCAAGQECNPDTNKCQPAQAVTCQDLGYECGVAWLGSGSRNTTKVNCGTCNKDPAKPRCNPSFNVCEPACTPPTTVAEKQAFCDAARASRGVQCGIISNGCGGVIDCSAKPVNGFTCASGQGCGVRGVANRCEPFPTPPECEAIGRNCGQITSVCTGQKISCGTCSVAGEVCNDNGVCGPPCTLKTCATALPAGQQCGSVSDGCKGTLDCRCPSGQSCQSGSCCKPKTCAEVIVAPNTCGRRIPNGCGGFLDCPCAGESFNNANASPVCLDGTGARVSNNEQGTCCTRKTCADYAGQCGTNFPDGCGGALDCRCANNQTCIQGAPPGTRVTFPGANGAAPVVGSCCNEANCNAAPGECDKVVSSVCVQGETATCSNCLPGQNCNAGVCCTPQSCGNQCNTTVDNCGQILNCACTLPSVCVGNTCVCTPLTCADYPVGSCGGPDNCGGNLNCCGAGQSCVGGVCCTPSKTCADYPGLCGRFSDGCNPTALSCGTPKTCGQVLTGGATCGFGLSDDCGGALNCPCGGGQLCVTGGPPGSLVGAGTGSCCAETSCKAPAGKCNVTQPSSCVSGQTVACADSCTGNQVCNGGNCCTRTRTQCPGGSQGGNAGDPCGSLPDGCGNNIGPCSCKLPNSCGGGGTPGVCGCTKKTCADYPGQVGALPDGCGGVINPPCTG